MVIESSRAIAEVAREIQVNEGTLGNWANKYRVEHADEEPPLSVSDRARLRELERENRELRMKAEFLEKVRHEHWRRSCGRGLRGLWCCVEDGGLMALRSRPAGGGFKPPHAASGRGAKSFCLVSGCFRDIEAGPGATGWA